jgi:hypothetical protein
MNDEKIATKIVRLYFEEIARLGFKRQLDLGQIINAYFYTQKRLVGKEQAMREAMKRVIEEEKKEEGKTTIKTTTQTVTTEPDKSTFTEIIKESK